MGGARKLIGVLFLVVLIGLSVWVFMAMQGDDSKMLGFALGDEDPEAGTVEMHIEVTQMMENLDQEPFLNVNHNVILEDWAMAHYVVTDAQGHQVPLTGARRSDLVSDAEHRGFTTLFLIGKLQKGTPYTYTYIPVVGEPEKYAYTFTPGPDNMGRQKVKFKPVK